MEQEKIKIVDKNRNETGIFTRKEVHKKGYWHETFHCWIISREEATDYIHLQIRSDKKKDFPSLLDITAAGHLLADENVEDGLREVKEELGITISFDELIPLGVIEDCMEIGNFIDNEFAHVFAHQNKNMLEKYTVQQEEVAGVVKIKFDDFSDMWIGKTNEVYAEGFEWNESGEKIPISKAVNKSDFVPHHPSYFKTVTQLINQYSENKN